MKKMNNKGFMLTETLIVSILLIIVLLTIYVQFKKVNRSVENSFSYNTVSSLYNLYNVKLYFEQEKFNVIVANLDEKDYVELTDCSEVFFERPSYCKNILNSVGIKRVFATNENLYSLVEKKPFNQKLNNYIASIDYEATSGYRLIAEFEDGSYASLKFLNEDKFTEQLANTCVMSIDKKFVIHFQDKEGEMLKESLESESGCGSTISVNRFSKNIDSCYYVDSLSKETLVISENEEENVATITFSKYASKLTIHHVDEDNNKLAEDTVLENLCGTVYETENYKKLITNYNYSRASETRVTLSQNNKEVSLYYVEGSGIDE